MNDLDSQYSASTSLCLSASTWLSLLAAIALLAVGGWIYVAARPETYLCNIGHAGLASPLAVRLPDFVLYSLPDGLWALSSILMLHPFLRLEPMSRRIAIIAVVPLLGIISELLQAVGWLPGVFDVYDLACYALPLVIYLLCQSFHIFYKS